MQTGCKWTPNWTKIEEAKQLLGVTGKISIRPVYNVTRFSGRHRAGMRVQGDSYRATGAVVHERYDKTVHDIVVYGRLSPEEASRTLWHELTHAAQSERIQGFSQEYAAELSAVGYRDNKYEREARENEAFHDLIPLMRVAGTPPTK